MNGVRMMGVWRGLRRPGFFREIILTPEALAKPQIEQGNGDKGIEFLGKNSRVPIPVFSISLSASRPTRRVSDWTGALTRELGQGNDAGAKANRQPPMPKSGGRRAVECGTMEFPGRLAGAAVRAPGRAAWGAGLSAGKWAARFMNVD